MPDFKKAELTHQLTFEGAWPSAVTFIDSDRVVAGNRDGQMYLWDLTQEPVELTEEQQKNSDLKDRAAYLHPARRLDGHTNGISHLLTADGGKTLISTSLDHSVRLWDTTASPSGEGDAVLDVAQRRRLIKRDRSNEEEVLSQPGIKLATQTESAVLDGHKDWILGCSITENGQRLLTGDDAGTSILWDLPGRKQIRSWKGHELTGVVSVSITPDGKKTFISEYRTSRGSFDRPPAQAKIFNTDDGEMLVDLLVVKFPKVKARDNSYGYASNWRKWMARGFVTSQFSPDGKTLAVGMGGETGDAKVYLIDVESGEELRTLSQHQGGICDVLFTADGKHLLSTGRDTVIRIVNVADGKEVATLHKSRGGQFKDWLSAIALSPSEDKIAAADIGGLVHFWKV